MGFRLIRFRVSRHQRLTLQIYTLSPKFLKVGGPGSSPEAHAAITNYKAKT